MCLYNISRGTMVHNFLKDGTCFKMELFMKIDCKVLDCVYCFIDGLLSISALLSPSSPSIIFTKKTVDCYFRSEIMFPELHSSFSIIKL